MIFYVKNDKFSGSDFPQQTNPLRHFHWKSMEKSGDSEKGHVTHRLR